MSPLRQRDPTLALDRRSPHSKRFFLERIRMDSHVSLGALGSATQGTPQTVFAAQRGREETCTLANSKFSTLGSWPDHDFSKKAQIKQSLRCTRLICSFPPFVRGRPPSSALDGISSPLWISTRAIFRFGTWSSVYLLSLLKTFRHP